jgi:hypothetical protein
MIICNKIEEKTLNFSLICIHIINNYIHLRHKTGSN